MADLKIELFSLKSGIDIMAKSNYLHAVSGSRAEDLFIELFTDVFGTERSEFLYSQYPFMDIYQSCRYADFVLNDGLKKMR